MQESTYNFDVTLLYIYVYNSLPPFYLCDRLGDSLIATGSDDSTVKASLPSSLFLSTLCLIFLSLPPISSIGFSCSLLLISILFVFFLFPPSFPLSFARCGTRGTATTSKLLLANTRYGSLFLDAQISQQISHLYTVCIFFSLFPFLSASPPLPIFPPSYVPPPLPHITSPSSPYPRVLAM